ncbi:MAG: hypothetical protein CMJ49_06290 [Planctomycetaceae bacterium]|nr:hypothetical protein [Planctomycetaceae bacterium]
MQGETALADGRALTTTGLRIARADTLGILKFIFRRHICEFYAERGGCDAPRGGLVWRCAR